MRKQLEYDKGNCRVVLTDDTQNAFYTDKFNKSALICSDDVVDKVVEMFNAGKSLVDIDEYLLDEEKCSQEAREIIVEGLYYIYFPVK